MGLQADWGRFEFSYSLIVINEAVETRASRKTQRWWNLSKQVQSKLKFLIPAISLGVFFEFEKKVTGH